MAIWPKSELATVVGFALETQQHGTPVCRNSALTTSKEQTQQA